MEAPLSSQSIWRKPWFERVYHIGIIIKAIDGALELIAGIAILISPHLIHSALRIIADEFGEHNERPFQFLSEYVGHVNDQLFLGGLAFLITFLIFHGIIKIGLVYCLLKKIERAYPVALIVLSVFWLYEIYVFITSLSVPLGIFILLDAGIIILVWNEYQEIKSKAKKVVE